MTDNLNCRHPETSPQQSAGTEGPGEDEALKNLAPLDIAWLTAVLPLLGVLAEA